VPLRSPTYIARLIENQPGRDAQVTRKGNGLGPALDVANFAVVAVRYVKLAGRVESKTGRVCDLGRKLVQKSVGFETVERGRKLLAPRAGARKQNGIVFRVDRRVGDDMHVLDQLSPDQNGRRLALFTVAFENDLGPSAIFVFGYGRKHTG
jgi:hypothetical protein